MEIPQITIKKEIDDNLTLATKSDLYYETQTLDLKEIKVEPMKMEPSSYVLEPDNLNQDLKLSEEANVVGHNKYFLDCSLNKISKQEGLEKRLEESKESKKIDFVQPIKNVEPNIKNEESVKNKGQRNLVESIQQKQHKESATKNSKKKVQMEVFKCDHCKYRTYEQRLIKLHLMDHKKPAKKNKYKCEFCDFETNTLTYLLKTHMLQHKKPEETTMYKCDQCDYQTIHKGYLIQCHLLKHKNPDDVDLFKCDQCDYQTGSRRNFNLHHIKHKNPDGSDAFKCNQCDYKSLYKRTFQRHLLKHKTPDEVETFKCAQCDYQTIFKGNLGKHVIIHQKPYECEYCDYKTVYKKSLRSHIKGPRCPGLKRYNSLGFTK